MLYMIETQHIGYLLVLRVVNSCLPLVYSFVMLNEIKIHTIHIYLLLLH